mgnify:FL=1
MTSAELRIQRLEDQIKQMERRLRLNEDRAANLQQQSQSQAPTSVSALIRAKTTGTISARSGTTAGSGTADIWKRSGSTLSTTSVTGVTVYNQYGSSVASGKYIWVSRVDDGYELISSEC